MNHSLTMRLLKDTYGVCRLDKTDPIPDWAVNSGFSSITRTMDELSIVCLQSYVPETITCERDWRILKIEGQLDFSLIGILSAISSILAKEKISIFAVSTYDTDYILVKEKDREHAVEVLGKNGYDII